MSSQESTAATAESVPASEAPVKEESTPTDTKDATTEGEQGEQAVAKTADGKELQEVEVATLEEDEEVLLKLYASDRMIM